MRYTDCFGEKIRYPQPSLRKNDQIYRITFHLNKGNLVFLVLILTGVFWVQFTSFKI